MEKKIILFNIDILIKIYRGNKELRKVLVANADCVSISVSQCMSCSNSFGLRS